jgi:hypothetical protein
MSHIQVLYDFSVVNSQVVAVGTRVPIIVEWKGRYNRHIFRADDDLDISLNHIKNIIVL